MNLWRHQFPKLPTQIWSLIKTSFNDFKYTWSLNMQEHLVKSSYIQSEKFNFKTFRAEIIQIFALVMWKIDDIINSFWLYLTFSSVHFTKTIASELWNEAQYCKFSSLFLNHNLFMVECPNWEFKTWTNSDERCASCM